MGFVYVFYLKKKKRKAYQSLSWLNQEGKGSVPTSRRLGSGGQAGLSGILKGRAGDQNRLWIPCPWATFSGLDLPWDSVGRGKLGGGPGLRHPDSLCSSPGGLCNLCSDRANKEHILQTGGVPLIINCLSSPNEETVLSAVTTIMYLSSPGSGSHPELTAMPVVQCMLRFSLSANARLRNLAQIFLEDFCSPGQLAEARSWRAHSALGIPLPRTEAPQQP